MWRVHLPAVEALVYLNGKYLEHHQPEDNADLAMPQNRSASAMQPKNDELVMFT